MKLIKRARESLHRSRHRLRRWFNRLRLGYGIRRKGRLFQIIVPSRHAKRVRYLKYFFTAIGLLSALVAFPTVWQAFLVAVVIFIVSFVLEKTILAHSAVFIHALPTFELDPDKWKGVGFGYARPPGGPVDIPIVGMILTEKGLANDLAQLFLAWTEGEFDDEAKNLRLSVVVLSPQEYIFMCYPNPNRPIAREWFDKAKQELRQTSLEDVLIEHHGLFVLGKRCAILQTSYFPEFRRRLLPGTPVMLGFFLPPFSKVRFAPDTPTFVIHDFVVKDKTDLTRQDLEYDAVGTFESGGEWQGPPDLAP